jgi:hypothetical protein
MNEITIKTDDQQDMVSDKKNPANDDDLYSASLLEQINVVKSKKYWKLAFFFTISYIFISSTFFYLNFKNEIISFNSLILIFQSQKIQLYAFLAIIPIPLIWIYFIITRKLNEISVISDGLLKTALRLTHPAKSSEKAINSLSGAINNEINQITKSVNEAIKKSSELEKILSMEIEQIETSMLSNENKMLGLIDALKAQKNEIIDAASSTSIDIKNIIENNDKSSQEIEGKINFYVTRLTEIESHIGERLNSFELAIDKIKQSSSSIGNNSSEILENLDSANKKIDKQSEIVLSNKMQLDQNLSQLNEVIKDQNLMLNVSISDLTQTSNSIAKNILDENEILLQYKNKIEPKLTDVYHKLENDIINLSEITENFEVKINTISQSSVQKIDEKLQNEIQVNENLSEKLREISTNITKEIQDQISSLKEVFSTINYETSSSIEKQKFEIEKSFDQKVLELNAKTKMMISSIKEITKDTTDQLNVTIKDILKSISSNFNQTAAMTDKELINLQNTTEARLMALSDSLIDKSKELSLTTINNIDSITNDISKKIIDFKDEANSTSINLVSKISSSTGELASELVEIQKDTVENINNQISQITSAYKDDAENLTLTSKSLMDQLEKTRSIMKKDLFELPDETSHYLEKMRHVIEEQINAINHLNNLVSEYDNERDIEKLENKNDKIEPHKELEIKNTKYNRSRRTSNDRILPDLLSPKSRMNEKKNLADNQRFELIENEILDIIKIDFEKLPTLLPNKQPTILWESYYNGDNDTLSEKSYSRLGRRVYSNIKVKYSENKSFRSLINKYLKVFEGIISNYQKNNDESKISTLLDSESGILYILVSHSIGKLD